MRTYWFAVGTTFILPLGLIIGAAICQRKIKPVLLGVLCFTIMQLFLRIPLLRYVAAQAWYTEERRLHPLLIIAGIALSAGLFEEIGRWIFMKKGKLKSRADCIAFGIGHGGIEALVLVGLNVVLLGSQPQTGIERLSAMLLQVSLTVFVWYGLCHKQKSRLLMVIFLHGLIDFFTAYLQMKQMDIWTIEWIVCGISLLLAAISLYVLGKEKHEKQA